MSKRSYVLAFCLWLDNPEMAKVYDYIVSGGHEDFKPMGIHHVPEADEKKPHEHIMVVYPNQRTADGVRKSFGVYKTVWRLAKMQLKTSCEERLVKIPSGSTLQTETGYVREIKWYDKEGYVLKNPNGDPGDPDNYIEVPYTEGEKHCREPCKDDEVWRLVPCYRVPHVECITDRSAYAMYMLHRDPQSTIDGKKHVYNYEDLYGDRDFISSCFPVQKKEDICNFTQDLLSISCDTYTFRDFLLKCVLLGRNDLIELANSRPYLIKQALPQMHIDEKYKNSLKDKLEVF